MTTEVHDASRLQSRVWTFTRHYLEMVAAMLLGMATLYPVWAVAVGGIADDAWIHRADVDAVVMATAMTIPMVLWMRLRGHGPLPILEMSAAMYASFVLLFPFLWWGGLTEVGMMVAGHVLMPLLMLGAMLVRRDEYAGHC